MDTRLSCLWQTHLMLKYSLIWGPNLNNHPTRCFIFILWKFLIESDVSGQGFRLCSSQLSMEVRKTTTCITTLLHSSFFLTICGSQSNNIHSGSYFREWYSMMFVLIQTAKKPYLILTVLPRTFWRISNVDANATKTVSNKSNRHSCEDHVSDCL